MEPYRAHNLGLGNVQTEQLNLDWLIQTLYRIRRNRQMTDGNENGLGAVPPWPMPQQPPVRNWPVTTFTTTAGLTLGNHIVGNTPFDFVTQNGPQNATRITEPFDGVDLPRTTAAQRRALRRLAIHPLRADLTEEPKPQVMSEDAKAFWRGDHFYFDCQ